MSSWQRAANEEVKQNPTGVPPTPNTTTSTAGDDENDSLYEALPPIRVLDFELLRKRGSIPRYPDDKNLTCDVTTVNFEESFLVFLSHCWLRPNDSAPGFDKKPHPDNANHDKFALLVGAVTKIWEAQAPKMKKCFVWIDYACINQDQDPAGELKQLDKIIQLSDIMLTVIVDDDYLLWRKVASSKGWLVDYGAKAWNEAGSKKAYLNRAWCRVEMLYAAFVTLCDHQRDGYRLNMFAEGSGLEFALRAGRRPHYIYGTKEHKLKFHPLVLPPLLDSNLEDFNPAKGELSWETDRPKIVQLMDTLTTLYPKEPTVYGYVGSLDARNRRCGLGTYRLPDGSFYEGGWLDDVPDGLGRYVFPNGDSYSGGFLKGQRSGLGSFNWSLGGKIEGRYHNDQPHGVCVITTPMCGIYLINQYTEGIRRGDGKIMFGTTTIYNGDFKNDLPNPSCFNLTHCGYVFKFAGTLVYENVKNRCCRCLGPFAEWAVWDFVSTIFWEKFICACYYPAIDEAGMYESPVCSLADFRSYDNEGNLMDTSHAEKPRSQANELRVVKV